MIIYDSKTPEGRKIPPEKKETAPLKCVSRKMTPEDWERYGPRREFPRSFARYRSADSLREKEKAAPPPPQAAPKPSPPKKEKENAAAQRRAARQKERDELAERIKETLISAGLSRAAAAREIGLSTAVVKSYEEGVCFPRGKNRDKVMRFLKKYERRNTK